MKRETLMWIGLGMGCVVGLYMAIDFRETQEEDFHKANIEKNILQKKLKTGKESLAFLASHQKEIDFLKDKGWVVPNNRLVAVEFLENLLPLLKKVSYRFDPETVKNLADDTSFKVTQMTFEAESALDIEMYAFIDTLLKDFPGILVARELSLTRQDEPSLMKGKFVFEWVAMKEKKL